MNRLKENSLQIMNGESLSLPPTRVGRKRRSSILKPQRPFSDVQNLSRDDSRSRDLRNSKDRRVSFSKTMEVIEFNRHNLAGPSNKGFSRGAERATNGDIKQVALPPPEEPQEIQMSTPVKKKKRRISSNQFSRLSIIPKADKSFSFFPDDDFVIYEDAELEHHVMPPATAPADEITLLEELPDPQIGGVDLNVDVMVDLELNETGPVLVSSPHSGRSNADSSPSHSPFSSEPPAIPAAAVEEAERLSELFPQAALPTIIGTPPSGLTQYLAMATPDITTPQQERRRKRSVGCMAGRRLTEGDGVSESGECASVDETVRETKEDSVQSPLVPASLPVPDPSASCDDHVTLSLPEPPTSSQPGTVVDEGESGHPVAGGESDQLEEEAEGEGGQPAMERDGGSQMDLTCQSETLQSSVTGATPTMTATTPATLQQSAVIPSAIEDDVPDVAATVPPPVPSPAVFKCPKLPFRSQLKLKSSGRKVVKASPVVRTPRSVAGGLSSVHAPLTPLPILSATFTKTPLRDLAPVAAAVSVSVSVPTISSAPPSTPHTSPPPPSPSPSVTTTNNEVPIHSLLASPPPSDAASPAPPPTHPPWLQSPCESFNLVSSEDEAVEEDTTPEPDLVSEEVMAEGENQSCLEMMTASPAHSTTTTTNTTRLPLSQELATPAAVLATPTLHHTPAPSTHTAHLATALQHLQVSTGPKSASAPVTIETPETALIDVPPALHTSENDTLHMSAVQVALNDTTVCERSLLLSSSIYDKFVTQIYRDNRSPSQTPLEAKTDATLPLPTSSSPSPHTDHPLSLSVSSVPHSPTLFSHFMSELTSRLTDMLCGVHQRLTSDSYTSSHHCLPTVLDKWSRVLAACLGTLTVLQQYGDISGLSLTHAWSSEGVPSELPQAPLGQEDMQGELSMKIEWIMELIGSYNSLLPNALVARDQAAVLYGWYFEEWSHDTNTQHVTVAVQSHHHQFELSASDIVTDRVSATRAMVELIWNMSQTDPPQQ